MAQGKLFVRVWNKEWQEVPFSTYPGGEILLGEIPELDGPFPEVFAMLTDSNTVMAFTMLVDALQRMGHDDLDATIPYVPYARQDRVKDDVPGNQNLGVAAFAKHIINPMGLKNVVIYDPHSDVTPAVINNVAAVGRIALLESADILQTATLSGNDVVILSPDAGALKTSYAIAEHFKCSGVVFAEKQRDMATGKITGTLVHNVESLEGKDVLIPDDICDGARTFIEIAKSIRASGVTPKSLTLYVTHGIFSKGHEIVLEHFDRVICKYDFRNLSIHDTFPEHFHVFTKEKAA